MNFKITVETEDLAGIEAIINQLHTLEQKGAQTEKKLSVSTPELIQAETEQIYPVPQMVPVVAAVQPPAQQQLIPQTQPTIQPPIAPPTAPKQYTVQELSLASRPIVEAGRMQEVVDFLHSFKKADGSPVQTIMDVPVEQYGAFAQGLRRMGGKI